MPPPKTCIASLILVGISAYLLIAQPHFEASERPDWMGYAVCMIIVGAVMLMIHNFSAAFCMVGINIAFVLIGVIKPDEFFQGFASHAVIATGTLCVFADAVFQTSILDVVMGPFLPTRAPLWEARLRVMCMGFLFSTFLNNTPVLAILLPVTESYCARASLPLRSMLMPLTFSIYFGANNSLIAHSSNLTTLQVTKDLIGAAYGTPEWKAPNFFSPLLIGFPIGVCGLAFMTFFTTTLLPCNEAGKAQSFANRSRALNLELNVDEEDLHEIPDADECLQVPGQPMLSYGYEYLVTFKPIRPLIGTFFHESGLDKKDSTIALKCVITQTEKGPVTLSNKEWGKHVLLADDLLIFSCTSVGVASLRKRRGIQLNNDNVEGLGAERRLRCLMEAVVGPSSCWVGETVTSSEMQATFAGKAAIIAVRQVGHESHVVSKREAAMDPGSPLMPRRKGSLRGSATSEDMEAARNVKVEREFRIDFGSLILLEAYPSFAKLAPKSHIPMVSVVPGSKPPRWYTAKDKLRMLAVGIVLCSVIFFAAANILPLTISGFLAIFFMVWLKIMTPGEAIGAIEGPTLLIIASSGGVGKAIQHTGLGEWLGDRFVELSFNTFPGLLIWFFVLMSLLGCFLNNNAQVVLVMPIAYSAAQKVGVSFRPFMYLCMMMTTISSFTIPISRATNLMIVNRGPYSFADFATFGYALQLFIMPIFLGLLYIFEVHNLWDYFNDVCAPYGSLC